MTVSDAVREATTLPRNLRKLLDGLGLATPLTPKELCAGLRAQSGRPIELVGRQLPPNTASGFLIVYEHKDLVVYQSETSELHQNHIAFHELAHLVLGHATGNAPVCGALLQAEASAEPGSLYDEQDEWEAETAATILSSWTDTELAGLTTANQGQAASTRLSAALGLPRPWR